MPALHLPSPLSRLSLRPLSRLLPLLVAACWNLPAHAMLNQVTYAIQYDGTDDFNLKRSGPGFDANKNNGIVRTHDAVGYAVALSTNGAETNPVIKLTLPQVNGKPIAEWAMPTQCQPGSSLSPDKQVISCKTEDFSSSATKTLVFNATVRGDVRNDTPFPAPAIEVKSDKVPAGIAPLHMPPDIKVTAAPFYDVRIDKSFPGNPAFNGVQVENGPLPDKKDGLYHRPLIGVYARNPDGGGKKGVEQLDPNTPLEIELDISGYPASVRVLDWDTGATGDFRTGCGSAFTYGEQAPGVLGGGRVNTADRITDHGPRHAPSVHTVANGGSCAVKPGTTRDRVTITLSGIDTELKSAPTQTNRSGTAIPRDEFWVANKALVLWTDLADYPVEQEIMHPLRFVAIRGSSISTVPQAIPAPDPHPAYHELVYEVVAKGQGVTSKTYTVDDRATPPFAAPRDPAFPLAQDVNFIAPNQSVRSVLRFSNTGTTTAATVRLCDILDRTAFKLAPHFSAEIERSALKDAGAVIQYQYGAPPAGESPYFDSVDSAPTPYELVGHYSQHGNSTYSQASCENAGIRWFNTWQEAENNGGLVYVKAEVNRIRPQGTALFHIRGLTRLPAWAATTTVQTPSPGIRQAGEAIADGTIIRNRAEITAANIKADVTKQRDHVMAVATRTLSRISKTIIDPVEANTQTVPAGSVLTYEIVPRYSTLFPPFQDTVTITDVLPKGTYYLNDTATVGDQKMEPVVQEDTPEAGMTTLTWTFPDRLPHTGNDGDPGARMPAIRFKTRLSNHLPNGTVVRNLVSISGGANDFEEDCRYHAASKTMVMTRASDNQEVLCVKSAQSDTTVQTQAGFRLEKTTSRARIEPGDTFDYMLVFVSMGQEISDPNLPDMIDILPFVGDGETRDALKFQGRSPASTFNPGAYQLVSVTPAQRDPNARIYFTNRNPKEIHNDPRDASNALNGGSTPWCLPAQFGTPGCPAAIGESTAIRVSPSIRLLQANVPYDVKVTLQSDPLRSVDGDVFANHVGTRPVDPTSRLLFVQSQADLHVKVIQPAGGLSGRVFVDTAQDNVFGADDAGVPNQCIRVSGTNAKGRQVLLSTLTDAQGHYAFTPKLAQKVYTSDDCTGNPLPSFGGLLDGTYSLTRTTDVTQLPGKTHAGSAGGTISADQREIGQIVLGSGVTATHYHFTESRQLPRLTLISTVTNDHGGTKTAADILLTATPAGQNQPSAQGTSGTPAVTGFTVPVGSINLNAPALPGYRASQWQCTVNGQPVDAGTAATDPQTLTLRHGDDAVCTIHYDDEPARLTLISTVTNTNGRTAKPEDFVLHADGPTTLGGVTGAPEVTAVVVAPGVYELREDELPNYVAGAWHCDAGTLDGNRLTLSNGEHATCTINNTDQPVSLTLVLDVINEHGGTATANDASVSAEGNGQQISGISGSKAVTVAPVSPGVYRLALPSLPGYVTGKWVCSGGTLVGDLLTLDDQQNVTCRIELKDIPATLKATKAVVGDVRPMAGSHTDYQVQYRLTVKHEAGAAALYALTDTPAFDEDVRIISTQIERNGQPLSLTAANDGSWMLADQQRLAIGAEDVYLMSLRVRIPHGSSTANNRCTTTGSREGKGLFNRLSLRNLGADTSSEPILAVACVDTPEPVQAARLVIEKSSTTKTAEVGDLITYRLRIRNVGEGPAISPVVVDRLPAGFRLAPGSVRVQGARAVEIHQGGARELHIKLDQIATTTTAQGGATTGSTASAAASRGAANDNEVLISYRVRLGVGSQEGDGINRAHVECLTPNGAATTKCSNESRWQVRVRAGIFTEEACVAGQVFVDCNGNSVKDAEELGIPGVRLYLQNGTWFVTDAHGKYSHCGLRPRTHVLKIDRRTLPRKSRLVTSSAQNSGDAESLFVDAKKGMLHRADFIEGSCSNTVIEQVKARQAQGENTSVQTEAKQPALSFESKQGIPARPRQQGTDSANQRIGPTRH
ncbi:MAG: hypothetical protein Q4D91_09700 [Lautropia sp.]|nr:hypothetical protein [Lautropia sp.]